VESHDPRYSGEKTILMIPGPSEIYPEVHESLARPIVAHYGKEWGHIYDETTELCRKVFRTKSEVIIVPGPGTLAIEMGIVNMLEPGEKAVCVVNGFFSERVLDIANHLEVRTVKASAPEGEIVAPERLKAILDENRDAKALLMVHNESSTGVLNPIKEYARLAKERGMLTLLDAVSSYGGIDLDMDGWGIDYCVGYANKCLGSIPSAAPTAVGPEVWDKVKKRKSKSRTWFTNLEVWRYYMDNWVKIGHPYPTTVNTYSILALREAARLALEEGLENRYLRHRRVAAAFRAAVRAMELEVFPKEQVASPTITAIKVPEKIASSGQAGKINELMASKHRVMIGGGVEKLSGKIIRVGHMGATASSRYILPTLSALQSTFRQLGYEAADGTGTFSMELSKNV